MSQAQEFQNAVKQHQVYKLAGSPLLLEIMSRLGIEAIIDHHAAAGKKQVVSHGQAGIALLLTRLLQPKALYKVADWLSAQGVDAVLAHEGAAFTDDCLGRMLDAISEKGEAIWLELLQAVLTNYPEMMEEIIQYDLTSTYFEGAYSESDLASYGYSRDHRSDSKQVTIGMSSTGKSKLPLLYELLAGNTSDNQTPLAHLKRLKQQLKQIGYPNKGLVLVGDRAMFNQKLIAAYLAGGHQFLGPWTPPDIREIMRDVSAEELLSQPLSYLPQNHKPSDPPPYYGVMRDYSFTYTVDQIEQENQLRVLVLYSRSKAKLDAGKREDHLHKLQSGLDELKTKLNQRRYKRSCYVEERIHNLIKRYSAARGLIQWQLEGQDAALTLSIQVDETTLDASQHMDGRYALISNTQLSANEMLRAFKQQSSVEQRFRILKNDVPIRPIHLHRDNRIQALVLLTMIALVIYSILEWRIRSKVPKHKRPWTTRAILEIFESLMVTLLVFSDGSRLWHPPPLTETQDILWQALGLPPLFNWLNDNCGI